MKKCLVGLKESVMYVLEQAAHKRGEGLGAVLRYWHLKKTSQSYQVQVFSLWTIAYLLTLYAALGLGGYTNLPTSWIIELRFP